MSKIRKLQCKLILKSSFLAFKNLLLTRKHAYCRYLWESVHIDLNGDVYSCCHNKPGITGNIYKHNLSDIWEKSLKLKFFRFLSRNRCLYCFFSCNILSAADRKNYTRPSVDIKYPKNVWILFGEFCNLECIMCPQDHHSKEILDTEILKKNIEWSRVERIVFQGGEILAMKKARDFYLWLAKTFNKKIDLITNGLLIDDEWAYHLINYSNWIQISVNAATAAIHEFVNRKSNFEKVINNIKKLIDLKHKYRSNIEIIYKFTIVPENIHEIAKAIEVAEHLGCTQIAYSYDYSVKEILEENTALRKKLKNQISHLLHSDLKLTVHINRLEQLDLI